MKRFLYAVAAGAALLSASAYPSLAVTCAVGVGTASTGYCINTIAGGSGDIQGFGIPQSTKGKATAFTDDFSVTLISTEEVIGAPLSLSSNGTMNITSYTIDGSSAIAGIVLSPGTYTIQVTGTWLGNTKPVGDGLGTFTGAISEVAITPLPAALPLFAAGLGLLGVMGLRKRRKVGSTVTPYAAA